MCRRRTKTCLECSVRRQKGVIFLWKLKTSKLIFICMWDSKLFTMPTVIICNQFAIASWYHFMYFKWTRAFYMQNNIKNIGTTVTLYLQHFEEIKSRINFYLLRTFPPHLGSFCVVSSFTTFRPNFTSGLLQVIYRDLG